MDDIQRRADDEAWDKKVNCRISDINHAIEKGLSGEALAALHGLRLAPTDDLPYDVARVARCMIKRRCAIRLFRERYRLRM